MMKSGDKVVNRTSSIIVQMIDKDTVLEADFDQGTDDKDDYHPKQQRSASLHDYQAWTDLVAPASGKPDQDNRNSVESENPLAFSKRSESESNGLAFSQKAPSSFMKSQIENRSPSIVSASADYTRKQSFSM